MLTALLVVLLVLVAVLAVPVVLTFRIEAPPLRNSELRIGWAFGLIDAPIPLQASGSKRKDTRSTSAGSFDALAALRQPDFRARLLRFFGDVWRAVEKRDLYLEARIGLGDPADTGRLWGLLGPLSAVLGNLQNATVHLTPDFNDAVLAGRASGTVRVVPLQLLGLVVALAVSPPIWRGLQAGRERATPVQTTA